MFSRAIPVVEGGQVVEWLGAASDVTARKQAENLQQVPIAVSVFSAESIESKGIDSIACITREAFSGFGSLIKVTSWRGTICHESPYLSFTQPQGPCEPPPAVSLSEYMSISAWFLQFTVIEVASLKVQPWVPGPSVIAKGSPLRENVQCMIVLAASSFIIDPIFEFGKIET